MCSRFEVPNENTTPIYTPANNDVAQMEDPIEPVTNFINKRAKSEVEFKRRKASKKKKGGFFLKIGKFELSKNKN